MLLPFRPTSNLERQRQFRARNPGYYGRLRAKRQMAHQASATAQAAAAEPGPLMLPAPVEIPLIPGLNAIPQTRAAARELAPLPVSRTEACAISEST